MKKLLSLVLIVVSMLSLTACGESSPYKDDVKVADILTAVKEAYGETYYPNMPYEAAQLEELFGVKADSYEEFVAEGPMISFSVDTFVAVKAKEGKVEEVKTALETYRDNLINNQLQYPTNKVKVENSRVDVFGNYVFFTLLGEIPMDVEEKGDSAIAEAAKEQNQKAITAIEGVLKK